MEEKSILQQMWEQDGEIEFNTIECAQNAGYTFLQKNFSISPTKKQRIAMKKERSVTIRISSKSAYLDMFPPIQ